jgi:hypothetical protein
VNPGLYSALHVGQNITNSRLPLDRLGALSLVEEQVSNPEKLYPCFQDKEENILKQYTTDWTQDR